MSDPFLLAHHVAPRVFNISGKITPVSIKDQMIRGRLFVDRAVESGEISAAPDRSLLVIGGGACGITAALRAAQLGVPATVLEQSPHLFGLQAGCATRWLDPFQYDWPLDHWAGTGFPAPGAASMPLTFPASWAWGVAGRWWLHVFMALATFGSSLRIHVGAQLASAPPIPVQHTPPQPFARVSYTTSAGPQTGNFGVVLVTTGFGTENTKVGSSFRGFPFWHTDQFAQLNCGLPSTKSARVLISGGGDGALQDFLRITTQQNSAKDVFRACNIPPDIAAALKDVERRSACAYHWGALPGHDHPINMELELEHRRQATRALQNRTVLANLKTLLTNRPKTLKLVHVCAHLTPFYSLNRFLTLLIAEYIKQADGVSVIEPQTSVSAVRSRSASHMCASSWASCHGEPHEVDLNSWQACDDKNPGPRKSTEQYNVVIIRHGISPTSPPFPALTPIAQPRQVLPFYLI